MSTNIITTWWNAPHEAYLSALKEPMFYSRYAANTDTRKKPLMSIPVFKGILGVDFDLAVRTKNAYESEELCFVFTDKKNSFISFEDMQHSKTFMKMHNERKLNKMYNLITFNNMNDYDECMKIIDEVIKSGALDDKVIKSESTQNTLTVGEARKVYGDIEAYNVSMQVHNVDKPAIKHNLQARSGANLYVYLNENDARTAFIDEAQESLDKQIKDFQERIDTLEQKKQEIIDKYGM